MDPFIDGNFSSIQIKYVYVTKYFSREAAEKYPQIRFEEKYLDTVCLNMVQVQGNSEKCTGAFKFGCRVIFYLSKICRKSGLLSHLCIEFTKKNIHIMC